MHDYYRYREHPIAIELESRISGICQCLAASNYSSAGFYRAQKTILRELLSVEDRIKTFRQKRSEIILAANQVGIDAKDAGRPVKIEEKSNYSGGKLRLGRLAEENTG